jgi:chaperone modulatory protein CbpM
MHKEYRIDVKEFCVSHNIENAFIRSLQETGLIDFISISEDVYIDAEQLQQLEKIVSFYYELDINLEGIETITHLLQRIKSLQDENTALRNRLRLYESED